MKIFRCDGLPERYYIRMSIILESCLRKKQARIFLIYVMEKRMENGERSHNRGFKKDRIYEVAEKVGYGSNSQYFSQVLKNIPEFSPLEYREFARLAREEKMKQVEFIKNNRK